jgi:hypothetical protein
MFYKETLKHKIQFSGEERELGEFTRSEKTEWNFKSSDEGKSAIEKRTVRCGKYSSSERSG